MVHKFCFEALDKKLRDLLQFDSLDTHLIPFGGKTIVFGSDFRQILLVISRRSCVDIVHITLNFSYLWESCHVLRLTKNVTRIEFSKQCIIGKS